MVTENTCKFNVNWTLWTSRNKRMIEKKFPRNPTELLFKFNVFLQKWKVLLQGIERSKVDGWTNQVKGWLEKFMAALRNRPSEEPFL